ncbi:N-alpha-acetyltransferase 16, NatA auxiliary subunit [Gossypium australe]|uniref:N-alpha-acetyltransferase 16, NatA auxiliary subunit n=1 Tax=Gossypium australe TaxID=47621 RepID=A0A5B6WDN5_9ROSI|nr:N-alpha-acetyltransferase 16, NatA auxiliary subunit [Gossypium australe]
MGASLPPKEANLFKLIVSIALPFIVLFFACKTLAGYYWSVWLLRKPMNIEREKSYETKQYKKGLKAADAILKKFPEHGETLSMKGLTLNCMDRKSEAYELVRLGLKNDLKSHVCWHVYGLLYRSDREYREAIKCYRNALRIDPDNIEILRDLSLLQAQMRDLTGFVETRQQLLTLKPNHRMNWIGFAVAHHLNSNGAKAVEILEAYEGTLEDDYPPDNERCEHGEMLLYKISLLEERGFLERALEELHKKEPKIQPKHTEILTGTELELLDIGLRLGWYGLVDKLTYKEQEVSLLVKLGRLEEGANLYKALLTMNPDNYRYYEGLQKCFVLYSENGKYSSDEIDQLDALYKSLADQYTWSSAVKVVHLCHVPIFIDMDGYDILRIPLDFLQGDKFREAAISYIKPLLTKGVPSLFSDLSPLYDHPGKADMLEQLILELEHSIRINGRYPDRTEKEPPSTLLWILFFLAQHYDRRGQYDVAISKIDEAIQHTPTVIDLYSVKSRILKHAGDLVAAASLADEARCMDLADRYINSECVKRMLQADQVLKAVALAEKTAVLFTKDGDQHNNLHDMQCMWYELASGESYFRQGDLGRALKKFLAVEKHYADITEDQFDFHSYCLRKMTLRAYVEMLKFQDRLHSHAYFHKAAAGAIRCYLKFYDSPVNSPAEEEDNTSKTPSQKKKMKKQRKAERAKKEAEEKNEESSASGNSKFGKRHIKPVDPDPYGEKLLKTEDPLSEATKYLKLLQKNSPDSLETHLLSFEVNMRKQKILLAFQAVKQLLRLDAENPDSHRCLIKFFHKVGSMPAPVTDAEKLVWSVLEAERPSISQLQEKTLIEANKVFLGKHEDSLMHRVAVAEMLFTLDPTDKPEAVKLIEDSSNKVVPTNGALGPVMEWKLKDCIVVHKLLDKVLIDQDAALRWKVRCAEYFPYSTYFEGGCSSAVHNSLNMNGGASHPDISQSEDALVSNGKLEAFKNLTI